MDSPIPKEQAIEGNDLIANFMGHTELISQHGIKGKYHMSWDWLIPVVNKVSKELTKYIQEEDDLDYHEDEGNKTIYKTFVEIDNLSFFNVDENTFKDTYKIVLNFIKCYNK